MDEFPHKYQVTASALEGEYIAVRGADLPEIITDAPEQFGGPGGRWSPETLMMASVADCFVLTFRAIAQASKLPWQALECNVEGTLERIDRVTKFTEISVLATLTVDAGTDQEKAERLLHKTEEVCLVTNSMTATTTLTTGIRVAG